MELMGIDEQKISKVGHGDTGIDGI